MDEALSIQARKHTRKRRRYSEYGVSCMIKARAEKKKKRVQRHRRPGVYSKAKSRKQKECGVQKRRGFDCIVQHPLVSGV